MIVAISGASGLVGSALTRSLIADGHTVIPMVRRPPSSTEIHWDPATGHMDAAGLANVDGVVHLAGENIAKGRWTAAKKHRIRESRVSGTRLLSETLASLESGPRVLVSASAIGFYGNRGEEWLDEDRERGHGFLAEVCEAWEAAAQPAKEAGLRTVQARIGVVLSRDGGALQAMLPPFQWGAGGIIGNGRQYWSWISLTDLVRAFRYLLDEASLAGPVNLTVPEPCTNAAFTKTLGRVLGRPTWLPMPAFAARLALGEMADELLLSSARVVPKKLLQAGFEFQQPDLEAALRALLK